jgi:putative addiction module antidote protein, CC2985 family
MTTMNISLPDTLKTFVDQQVQSAGYGTSSEYVRELIRRDRDRTQLRGALIEGLNAAVTGETDAAYFSGLRSRVTQVPEKKG